ncbi:globin [Alicyclobacillus mali]|uniref:Globin n=1 Tax=Alicyclobacillus mali (ex Roth et al. 2021) TaxID=1123961 RepID=A0ABS0F728_9BACL|nr:globin [Alicyclobacillus mali (ex Roth et al. 2021)]MBF8379107.1 globin [Alicyclobacillus mali (ex Roth et al. 2021)]MCL6488613.1 globin [Alicyclobacillus mali (ex Roth et al. 2021)]
METTTLYDAVGGASTFRRLVEAFYDRVAQDELLRPLFPPTFDEVKERQYWFLTQLFGGPRLYTERRGHPMLRARHLPFPITVRHAEHWLRCMSQALEEAGIPPAARAAMLERLGGIALHMVNTPGEEEQA